MGPAPGRTSGPDAGPAPRGGGPQRPRSRPRPLTTQPGGSHPGLRPRFREQRPPRAGSALRRYLLRSREAALRQSSRKQKSGYWRQISRPTSSRSRCFSFSPIVRTQGTISTGGAGAVRQTEVEATPIHLRTSAPPRLRPARLPARRPTPTAADRRTVPGLQMPKPRPRSPPRVRGRRPRGQKHHVPQVVTPRRPPLSRRSALRARVARRPPREDPAPPRPAGRNDSAPRLPGPACGTPRARGRLGL